MSNFWIIGIVINVTLTALAIYWVVKQMKPTEKKNSDKGREKDCSGKS